ncbi:MAG: aldehyde ferredoxin oxidoreductase family protein [Candidatus Hermodarchaeota archaeon]
MELGYSGNILRVNLSSDKVSIEHPDEIFYRKYIGGEGLISYYLLKEVPKGIKPLDYKNKLIFANGPLTGTSIPCTGRNSIGAKSPLTGGFGESEVGGYWGAELKHAGFDAVIVEGKASKPIYLFIQDEEVDIRDASHLWGKSTGETQKNIIRELDDKYIRVACIGVAAENLVKYACIINDYRNAAGRTGMGAVMGSKNLKAIAVRGHNKPKVNNKEKMRTILKESYETFKGYSELFAFGTGGNLMEKFASSGNLPTRNFRDGDFKYAKQIDPAIVAEKINLGRDTCYACPIRCKKVVNIFNPININPLYGGPEYETIAAFGSNCGISDIIAISKANEICNKTSLDTISAGVAISFAMECYENRILTDEDTNGLKLNFGNSAAMLSLLEKIVNREGLGNILAEGVKRAAENIGKHSQKFAIHVKGQEVPMHEPRLKQGMGIGYALSPTGAEHMANLHDTAIANKERMNVFASFSIFDALPLDDLSAKKVKAVISFTNWRVVENSLLFCFFSPYTMNQENQILKIVTGWDTSTWELMKFGERITTMARAFNIREGFNRNDDWLPDRFFEPHTTGALAEKPINPQKFKQAREMYYKMMGWDEDGIPTKMKLEELDIEWVKI